MVGFIYKTRLSGYRASNKIKHFTRCGSAMRDAWPWTYTRKLFIIVDWKVKRAINATQVGNSVRRTKEPLLLTSFCDPCFFARLLLDSLLEQKSTSLRPVYRRGKSYILVWDDCEEYVMNNLGERRCLKYHCSYFYKRQENFLSMFAFF